MAIHLFLIQNTVEVTSQLKLQAPGDDGAIHHLDGSSGHPTLWRETCSGLSTAHISGLLMNRSEWLKLFQMAFVFGW